LVTDGENLQTERRILESLDENVARISGAPKDCSNEKRTKGRGTGHGETGKKKNGLIQLS